MNVDFMRNIPLFMPLTDEETKTILRLCRQKVLRPGTRLFSQGEKSRSMYIIEQGRLVVFEELEDGSRLVLDTLVPGDVLGEMALIDPAPRSASVEAETPAVVHEIRADDFARLKERMDPAVYKLIRSISIVLCERLRAVNARISEMLQAPETLLAQAGVENQEEARSKGQAFLNRLLKDRH